MVVPPARVRLAVLFSQALVRGDDPEHQLPIGAKTSSGFADWSIRCAAARSAWRISWLRRFSLSWAMFPSWY
jgi:hypothetical protein